MDPESIRVSVEVTFEDYREACLALQHFHTRRAQHSPKQSLSWKNVVWTFAIGITVLAVATLDDRPETRLPAYPILTPFLPWAVLSFFSVVVGWLFKVTILNDRHDRWRQIRTYLYVFLPAWGLAAFAIYERAKMPSLNLDQGNVSSIDWFGALFPHLSWTILIATLVFAGHRGIRRQIEKAWELQPNLQQPRTFEVDHEGVSIREGSSFRRYLWPALIGLVETEHALLLLPSRAVFEILPKRSFTLVEQLNAARLIFERNIHNPDALPPAFSMDPALPAAQRAEEVAAPGGTEHSIVRDYRSNV